MQLDEFLKEHNAYWHWDGHKHVAQLTSGKLSDFFANCSPLYTDPRAQQDFADELVSKASDEINGFAGKSDNIWVVGSAMGAIGWAQAIAHSEGFRAAYTEPVEETVDGPITEQYPAPPLPNKTMVLKRFDLGEKPHVILCEDVITTGGTTMRTVAGILDQHPDAEICTSVLAMVNRSGKYSFEGIAAAHRYSFNVRSLIYVEPRVWDYLSDLPENMKDCVPIRPKDNWVALKMEKL